MMTQEERDFARVYQIVEYGYATGGDKDEAFRLYADWLADFGLEASPLSGEEQAELDAIWERTF